MRRQTSGERVPPPKINDDTLDDAFERCREVTAEYAKTFYLGTKLMTPRSSAIWAIYVWCRRTDELVDGPNATHITPEALDQWERRLEAVFEGRLMDVIDAALTDTVSKFPVDIQPFRDMIDGMRMDLVKPRYQTFDELYEYRYRVAGTVGLMSMPIMGCDDGFEGDLDKVYKAALRSASPTSSRTSCATWAKTCRRATASTSPWMSSRSSGSPRRRSCAARSTRRAPGRLTTGGRRL